MVIFPNLTLGGRPVHLMYRPVLSYSGCSLNICSEESQICQEKWDSRRFFHAPKNVSKFIHIWSILITLWIPIISWISVRYQYFDAHAVFAAPVGHKHSSKDINAEKMCQKQLIFFSLVSHLTAQYNLYYTVKYLWIRNMTVSRVCQHP